MNAKRETTADASMRSISGIDGCRWMLFGDSQVLYSTVHEAEGVRNRSRGTVPGVGNCGQAPPVPAVAPAPSISAAEKRRRVGGRDLHFAGNISGLASELNSISSMPSLQTNLFDLFCWFFEVCRVESCQKMKTDYKVTDSHFYALKEIY